MGLTNGGRDAMVQAVKASLTHMGVGDGTTAFAASQTDLQGTNKLRKALDATYPQGSANNLTFKATYGTSEANFAWNEWGIFTAISAGTMFQRKVESLGTKVSGTWVLTTTVTINN